MKEATILVPSARVNRPARSSRSRRTIIAKVFSDRSNVCSSPSSGACWLVGVRLAAGHHRGRATRGGTLGFARPAGQDGKATRQMEATVESRSRSGRLPIEPEQATQDAAKPILI